MKESPAERLARYKRLAALTDDQIDFSDAPEATPEQLAQGVWYHGGRRIGSGRKASGHIRMVLSVPPAFRRALKRKADKEGLTLSAYVQAHLGA